MKTVVLVILTLLILQSCSGLMPDPLTDEQKTFQDVITLDGQSKDEIYLSVNQWFVERFVSSESVIEFQDKQGGKISGKYVSSFKIGILYADLKSIITIDIKDGKARYTSKAINYKWSDENQWRILRANNLEYFRAEQKELFLDLKSYLRTNSNDDW